jgi:competence protein ComEC
MADRDSTIRPVQPSSSKTRRKRHPVVPIAIAFSAGIVADRFLAPAIQSLAIFASAAFICWLVVFANRKSQSSVAQRVPAILFLSFFATLGAIHHHVSWFAAPEDDIAQFLTQEVTLINVRGTVVGRPSFKESSRDEQASWSSDSGSTQFLLKCRSIADESLGLFERKTVSGLIQVDVFGATSSSIAAGDLIQLTGKANGIPLAHNPGEFDYGAYLRNQGIRGLVSVQDQRLVKVINRSMNPLSKLQALVRSRCDQFLHDHMSSSARPIAAALLLGDRTMIPTEIRASFVMSGAMHLLAISGLHIGILTAFILAGARLMGFGDRWSVIIVLVLLGFYLSIADMRPPMVRAFTLVSIWGLGRLIRRRSFSANNLAIAAVVVLAMNPSDLFDIGAQLSFLAVASIMWLMRVTQNRNTLANADIASMRQQDVRAQVVLPAYQEFLRAVWRRVKEAYLVSATVCLVSAPLVASAFNVVSPIGILINVVLIPIVGIALCCGFLGMLLGAIWFPLGWPLASVFDWVLRFVMWLIDLASSIQLGHFYVPSPPMWWLLATYAMIGTLMVVIAFRRRTGWGWIGLSGWLLFGVSISTQAMEQGSLKCTFLSVRHGCSILVELPNGQTLVYDVGSLMNPRRASRVLEHALWKKGHGSISALVLSHADSDHYNGTHTLLDHFPTRRVMMTRHFLDADQPGTVSICQRLVATKTPIDIIEKGDSIILDPSVSVRVLHPRPANSRGNDNSVSVVLEIKYAGRTILLTGDLEDPGLSELLAEDERSVDVLLSPHHGSPGSNTRAFAQWANARFVVASTGRPANEYLDELYGEKGQVFWTSRDGAVTFEISHAGEITYSTFVNDSLPQIEMQETAKQHSLP